MKNPQSILFCSVWTALCVLVTGVTGDDLRPPGFRNAAASVFSEFKLETQENPAPPDTFDWLPGPNGEPLDNSGGANVEFGGGFTWNQNGGGSWRATGENSTLRISMPNIVDDYLLKYIRLQITWRYPGAASPPPVTNVFGLDAEDGPLTDVDFVASGTMGVGGNVRHTYYDIRVRPNPDWEEIEMAVPMDMSILQIVVDTISVPTSDSSPAESLQMLNGFIHHGDITSTYFSDDQRLILRPYSIFFPNNPNPNDTSLVTDDVYCQCTAGYSHPTMDVVAMTMHIESGTVLFNVTQTIEMFNWTTQSYDVIDTRPAPTPEGVTEIVLLDYAHYLDPLTGTVDTRIGYEDGASGASFSVVIDWINWKFDLSIYDE